MVPDDSGDGVGGLQVGTLVAEITHLCHRRCAFCYLDLADGERGPDDPGAAGGDLSADAWVRLLSALMAATGCRRVQVSGGEPLLHREILPLLAGLRKEGARVSLLTDGAHLDGPLAADLARLGVGPVQPTLLSGRPALHDSLRGAGSFLATTRGIAEAAAAGLEISISLVLMAPTCDEAAAVAELAFALGARGLALSRLCPVGAAAARQDLMPTPAQVARAAREAARACARLGLGLAAAITIPRCVFPDPHRPPLPVGTCSLVGPRATVTVGPDGGVRSCSLSTRPVGNALRDPWPELAARLEAQDLAPLRWAIPDPCRHCRLYARCLAGCRLSALTATGLPDGMDPLAPGVP